jgi:type 1 glutamine amidotransferase
MNSDESNKVEEEFQNRTFLDQEADNILIITRGHPFERDPFFEMIDSTGYPWSHVEHPAAQDLINSETQENYKALIFYDMPGINFETAPPKPSFFDPSTKFKNNFIDLLKKGIGCVFIHHAIASWPNWEEYGNIVGGRFLYQEGIVKGVKKPDSGYRHDVKYKVMKDGEHPITKGIDDFDIIDELYLAEIFEDDINPILRSDYEFVDKNFYSAARALEGEMFSNRDWSHQNGSNIVGWTKNYENSSIAYLQFGDGPSSYSNENFRKLIKQSINWVIKETG